jgi:hypothetical protein
VSEQQQIIRWEEPPHSNRGPGGGRAHSGRYSDAADQLRQKPGQWAVLLESIRMGALLAFAPAGDFEATTRRISGRTVVYARYLGDGAE